MAEYYVVLGDVVHSRDIEDREAFQERLQSVCNRFTATERDDVFGNFKILKGVDEFGGVLQSIENLYEVVTAFQDELRPHGVRIVVSSGAIDVGLTSFDVEQMDGEAFHDASERLEEIEDGPLSFDLLVADESLGRAIADEVNLLLHLRSEWTDRQREVVAVREAVDTQTAAAEELGVSQQAVSNVLSGANWPLVSEAERRLRATLAAYAREHEGVRETTKRDVDATRNAVEAVAADVPAEYLEMEADRERFDAAAAHRLYADDLRQDGQYEEAAEHYEKALERDPDYAAAHVGYGSVLHRWGDIGEAADHYAQALAFYREFFGTYPGHTITHHTLARLLANHGRTAEAVEQYERYLDDDPDDESAYFEYAELALDGDRHDEALARLKRLLETVVESGTSQELLDAVQPRLTDVVEPLFTSATDETSVETVLHLLAELAERTTGTTSRDVENWSQAQYPGLAGVPHDRASPDATDPETSVTDSYATGLGYLLAAEPESAVQYLRNAWEHRYDGLANDEREYAWSAGVALLGCADVLGPTILDASREELVGELRENRDLLREPARRVLEAAEGDGDADPSDVREAVHDDEYDQFARLEARAFATLLGLAGDQDAPTG